jgi:hypothetical protein
MNKLKFKRIKKNKLAAEEIHLLNSLSYFIE